MRVAIVVFDGFDEIDAFVPVGLLSRLATAGWSTAIVAPTAKATSLNGVVVEAQGPLADADEADAVLFAGGLYTRAIAEDKDRLRGVLDRLRLDPLRQSIGAAGSASLVLARLGLVGDQPVCSDAATRPFLLQAGVRVDDASAFHARGPVATACGTLAPHHLATWLMLRGAGAATTRDALDSTAPAADAGNDADRLLAVVRPFVPDALD